MKKNETKEDINITRRNFLKKLTLTAAFTVPTIRSFKLMARDKPFWTGHGGHGGHGGHSSAPFPPPPPPPQ